MPARHANALCAKPRERHFRVLLILLTSAINSRHVHRRRPVQPLAASYEGDRAERIYVAKVPSSKLRSLPGKMRKFQTTFNNCASTGDTLPQPAPGHCAFRETILEATELSACRPYCAPPKLSITFTPKMVNSLLLRLDFGKIPRHKSSDSNPCTDLAETYIVLLLCHPSPFPIFRKMWSKNKFDVVPSDQSLQVKLAACKVYFHWRSLLPYLPLRIGKDSSLRSPNLPIFPAGQFGDPKTRSPYSPAKNGDSISTQ